MCRNHRGFIDATLAVSKLGANGLYMNTAFSGPQLADVVEREQPAALIYDEEFAGCSRGERGGAGDRAQRYVAWSEDGSSEQDDTTLDELIERQRRRRPRPARRVEPVRDPHLGDDRDAEGRAARLSPRRSARSRRCSRKIPLHARETTVIAAPLFHSWGFAHFVLGLALNSTYVLRRKFDPEETLKAIAGAAGRRR